MTPEQMQALADMIASRLMGTFAGRLDMIEEVVFSGLSKDIQYHNISHYNDIKKIILNRIRIENSITGLKIRQDKNISIIIDRDECDPLRIATPHGENLERHEIIDLIISEMVIDGSISAHKTSDNCTRYYDSKITERDAVMCLLSSTKITCPSAFANKAKNYYPFRLLGDESYKSASDAISRLIDSGDVVSHWTNGLKPLKKIDEKQDIF